MKKYLLLKLFLLVIFLTVIFNGCSIKEEDILNNKSKFFSNINNFMVFSKSQNFNWKNKNLEVSFEDEFQKFTNVDKLQYELSENNLKQGITIQLKMIDLERESEHVTEVMIEAFDLKSGNNYFTIGYKDNKPFIIY